MQRTPNDSANLPLPRVAKQYDDWLLYITNRRLYINCGQIEDLMSIPAERRKRISCVTIEFTPDIQTCITELKRFPNLSVLMLTDCDDSPAVGIDAYRGLSELKNLETFVISDSAAIDAETIKEIARMPSLRSLAILSQSLVSAKVLEGLVDCKSLEHLELWLDQCDVFAEDLAFVAGLDNLKWLDLDGCDKIDVTRLCFPKSLVAFTPPNYGFKAAKKVVPEGCRVLSPSTIHPPCRNRYMPQAQKETMALARKGNKTP